MFLWKSWRSLLTKVIIYLLLFFIIFLMAGEWRWKVSALSWMRSLVQLTRRESRLCSPEYCTTVNMLWIPRLLLIYPPIRLLWTHDYPKEKQRHKTPPLIFVSRTSPSAYRFFCSSLILEIRQGCLQAKWMNTLCSPWTLVHGLESFLGLVRKRNSLTAEHQ